MPPGAPSVGGRAPSESPAPPVALPVERSVAGESEADDGYSDVESVPDLKAGSETESEPEDDKDDFDGILPAKPTFSLEKLMAEEPALVRLAAFDEPCLPRARERSRSKRRYPDTTVPNPTSREQLIPDKAWDDVSQSCDLPRPRSRARGALLPWLHHTKVRKSALLSPKSTSWHYTILYA